MIQWELIPLLAGFIIEYYLYTKYKFRMGGVVIIPLLAIYAINQPFSFPFLMFLTAINYFILEYFYSHFIIYGRRLLYLSLIIGIVLSLAVGFLMDVNLSWYGFLIQGLFAYNLHRESNSTANKIKSIAVSSAIFLLLIFISIISLYFIW